MVTKIEIKRISEKEFWIGENKASLIEKNIIYVIAVGEVTTELAIAQIEVHNKLEALVDGPVNYLIDLNNAGKSSPEARKIWEQIGENAKKSKLALFGLNSVARMLASFVMGISGKSNQRFFKTKEEALRWLREE
jgi:hypothetical protein